MNRYTLRFIIILAAISIIGILLTQIFWVRKAFDLKEKQFSHNVNIALRRVVERILKYNQIQGSAIEVHQLSPDYFMVMVNNEINADILEPFLREELINRSITADFEYGIYDCMNEQMVYGDYVSLDQRQPAKPASTNLPTLHKDNYYFGVYFPNKDSNLISQMGIWAFSTLVLVIVVMFFVYTLFVILKQKRLSEVQRDFINTMTHEFKTPISTIAISSEVLKNPSILHQPGRLLNYATIIGSEASKLKSQVDRVLQMATSDKEEIKLNREAVDVHSMINQVVEQLRLLTSERNASIHFDLQASQAVIEADRLHLSNMLYNLLDNAMKYTKNQPHILITTCNEQKGIRISIQDNGIGISPEHNQKVFDKFYRVPTGNLHDVKGFGLGLSYVRNLVKAHRGRISLESKLHQGSTFSIFLPTF